MSLRTKYKPKSLTEIIYPNNATQTRVNALAAGSMSGNVIFHGPNGTGKSSVADLLPYAISGKGAYIEAKSFDELMKMDSVKEYIKNCTSIARMAQSNYFLVMHEMDNVKGRIDKLWTALDDVADEAMLIVTTNQPAKLHKSLSSRCKLIAFPAISPAAFLARAQFILKSEGVNLTDTDVISYLQQYEKAGDLRRYFDVLEDLIFLQQQGSTIPKPSKPLLRSV